MAFSSQFHPSIGSIINHTPIFSYYLFSTQYFSRLFSTTTKTKRNPLDPINTRSSRPLPVWEYKYNSPGFPSPNPRLWQLIDARRQDFYQLTSYIVKLLTGEFKVNYSPLFDMGDAVVVVNCNKFTLPKKEWLTKFYFWHTQYPGGKKRIKAIDWFKKKNGPCQMIRKEVFKKIPKDELSKNRILRLFLYEGTTHPHTDIFKTQAPKFVEVNHNPEKYPDGFNVVWEGDYVKEGYDEIGSASEDDEADQYDDEYLDSLPYAR